MWSDSKHRRLLVEPKKCALQSVSIGFSIIHSNLLCPKNRVLPHMQIGDSYIPTFLSKRIEILTKYNLEVYQVNKMVWMSTMYLMWELWPKKIYSFLTLRQSRELRYVGHQYDKKDSPVIFQFYEEIHCSLLTDITWKQSIIQINSPNQK